MNNKQNDANNGEKNLAELIKNMKPELGEQIYVFVSVTGDFLREHPALDFWASIREDEGTTLILAKEKAVEAELNFSGEFRRITLKIHSSLDAVGLTAAVSKALADNDISANVVAGFYHDHIFVQVPYAKRAVSALEALSKSW